MIEISVPGRICLLGDKADLGSYSVLAATINLEMRLKLTKRNDNQAIIESKNLNKIANYDITRKNEPTGIFKYIMAINNQLSDKISGYNLTINSAIPIGAGLSSSAAISVGTVKALNQEFNLELNNAEIAELAYRAEHDDCGIMCGRMDQYSITYGGVTYIETSKEPKVEPLKIKELPIVIADSQEYRQAGKVLNVIKKEFNNKNPLVTKAFMQLNTYVNLAKQALKANDYQTLGELMNRQQLIENKYNKLGINCATEKVNKLCQAALKAGALGAKQIGAGGGGCMIALCPGKQKEVADALKAQGGKVYI